MNWTQWLQGNSGFGLDGIESTGWLLALALSGSLVTSVIISVFYHWFFRARATGSQIHRAFPLIGPAITAIFIAVQFSLPLSLGLLGALSIVRFRTPIKEGEEIGFILLVVAVSLSWAVLNLQLLGIVLLVAFVGLVLTSQWRIFRSAPRGGVFVLTVPTTEYAEHGERLLAAIEQGIPGSRIESVTDGPEESVVTYLFTRFDRAQISRLRESLTAVTPTAAPSVFFNR